MQTFSSLSINQSIDQPSLSPQSQYRKYMKICIYNIKLYTFVLFNVPNNILTTIDPYIHTCQSINFPNRPNRSGWICPATSRSLHPSWTFQYGKPKGEEVMLFHSADGDGDGEICRGFFGCVFWLFFFFRENVCI